MLRSASNHGNWTQAGHFGRQTGPTDDIDDSADIFGGLGSFLSQPGEGPARIWIPRCSISPRRRSPINSPLAWARLMTRPDP
jgi:hypothetical protein